MSRSIHYALVACFLFSTSARAESTAPVAVPSAEADDAQAIELPASVKELWDLKCEDELKQRLQSRATRAENNRYRSAAFWGALGLGSIVSSWALPFVAIVLMPEDLRTSELETLGIMGSTGALGLTLVSWLAAAWYLTVPTAAEEVYIVLEEAGPDGIDAARQMLKRKLARTPDSLTYAALVGATGALTAGLGGIFMAITASKPMGGSGGVPPRNQLRVVAFGAGVGALGIGMLTTAPLFLLFPVTSDAEMMLAELPKTSYSME